MEPFPAGLYYPASLASGMAQKRFWLWLHVCRCSSAELAPHHAQPPSKFKSSASWLGNKDLDSAAASKF